RSDRDWSSDVCSSDLEANVREAQPSLGGEDFSYYQKEIPGLFIWLGIATPGAAPGLFAANHSPRFRIDESGLKLGVRALSRLTVDRKSTRLNSSHDQISYAVFCLKKKKK